MCTHYLGRPKFNELKARRHIFLDITRLSPEKLASSSCFHRNDITSIICCFLKVADSNYTRFDAREQTNSAKKSFLGHDLRGNQSATNSQK